MNKLEELLEYFPSDVFYSYDYVRGDGSSMTVKESGVLTLSRTLLDDGWCAGYCRETYEGLEYALEAYAPTLLSALEELKYEFDNVPLRLNFRNLKNVPYTYSALPLATQVADEDTTLGVHNVDRGDELKMDYDPSPAEDISKEGYF